MKHIDPALAASIADAVRSLEAQTAAELVVDVRSRSASYADAAARGGAIAAYAALLFILFSRWTFAPLWVPVGVLVAFVAGLLITHSSRLLQRLLTTRGERERKVRRAAAAAFFERGIANTGRETGLLLYVSLTERHIELLADRAVLDAVPVLEWNQLIEQTRKRHATLSTILDVIRALDPLLTKHLPVQAGDRDELADEVRFATE